jgi:vacuolar-type H+-ATPase subunit H
MDVLYLLERLEEVLSSGSRLPFTNRTLVDDEECFAVIDQIRLSLPNEIREARKVSTDRAALLDEAQARAQQILRSADMEAIELAKEHTVSQIAEARAQEILARAEEEAQQIRRDADDYAYRVLQGLDQQLDALLTTVRNGLRSLRRDEPAARDATREWGETVEEPNAD